jgi:hypothetical protein
MDGLALWIVLGSAAVVALVILLTRRRAVTLESMGFAPPPDESHELERLRRDLRVKVMHDEEKVDRLIEAERRRRPEARAIAWHKAAISRWERDNR